MNPLKTLQIDQYLATAIGGFVVLLVIATLPGMNLLRVMRHANDSVTDKYVPILNKTADWQVSLLEDDGHARNTLVLHDRGEVSRELARLRKDDAVRDELIGWLRDQVKSDEGKAALAAMESRRGRYSNSSQRFTGLVESGDLIAARNLMVSETLPAQADYLNAIAVFEQTQRHHLNERALLAGESLSTLRISVAALMMVFGIGAVSVLLLGRSNGRALRAISPRSDHTQNHGEANAQTGEHKREYEHALTDQKALVETLKETVLDQVAIIDLQGTVTATNSMWREFAELCGADACSSVPRSGLGSNYLAECRDGVGRTSSAAIEAANGISAVLSGRQDLYSLEYECPDPHRNRWFIMSVARLPSRTGGAVIVHTAISPRHRL